MATDGATETVDYQKALAEKEEMVKNYQSQVDALKAKTQELLEEKKKVQSKAASEAAEKQKVQEESLLKRGEYEQLFKSGELRTKELEQKLQAVHNERASERSKNEAMKLASQLADGVNAELLSDFIGRRIKYIDDSVKVLNTNGELTVSTLDDLKREFETSEKYKSLLRGSKASGGGASGSGSSGSSVDLTMERKAFDKMLQKDKAAFMKKGGKLFDQ